MLTKPLRCILSCLTLAASIHGHTAPISGECTAQAWVRAPDLAPNTIIQGEARVKISAECSAVDNVSLGLRFKERSFVKALRSREDAKRLPLRPVGLGPDPWIASPWPPPPSWGPDHEGLVTNRDLWFVREEERSVFEATQPFSIGDDGGAQDAVQKFAVLIPPTNFPPALEKNGFRGAWGRELLEVEWMYEYFVQIAFSDGTTKDIFAGYTAFQPPYDPGSSVPGPSSATAELVNPNHGEQVETTPTANYSIEIISDSGLTFSAGTTGQSVDAIITRTGLARTFSAPLKVSACIKPALLSRWRVQYGLADDDYFAMNEHMLRDKEVPSRGRRPLCAHKPIAVTMPSASSDEIEANESVTTSAKITIPIALQNTHIIDFDTYYQTLTNALSVTLQVPRAADGGADPDGPYGGPAAYYGPMFEDDEEAWVPWERPTFMMNRIYSGRALVAVHPATEATPPQRCLPAGTLGQVVLPDDTSCKRPSLTHYLDEGARGPVFVDYDNVDALLEEDPLERTQRAPILKPVLSSPPDGEERVYRYYLGGRKQPIYVGETWAKRVARKDEVLSAEVSDGRALHYGILGHV